MKKVHIFSISALRTLFVTLSNGAVIWLQTDSLQPCLTRSLTFCQTSRQKSCFWPFSQFRLFDRHCQPSVWNGQFGSLFCKFSHTKLFSNNFFFFHLPHFNKTASYFLCASTSFFFLSFLYHSFCICCPSGLIPQTRLWSHVWKQKQWKCKSSHRNNTS